MGFDHRRKVCIRNEKQVFTSQWLITYGEHIFSSTAPPEFRYWPIGIRMKRNNPYINPIPMIKQEKPWEMGMVGAYSSVVFDKKVENLIDDKAKGGQFRCFYEGFEPGLTRSYLCYAESQDGCVWIKPELNLVDWDGSTANNIQIFS
jgi:hypothetical protein